MKKRGDAAGTIRPSVAQTPRNVGGRSTLRGVPGRFCTSAASGDLSVSPPGLDEPEWQHLVDLLLQVSPEDFEAAVAAVRLHRRLEGRLGVPRSRCS